MSNSIELQKLLKPDGNGCLNGTIHLPNWAGFASTDMRDRGEISDGNITLVLGEYEEGLVVDNTWITPFKIAAYEYLVQESQKIQDVILNGLFTYYRESEDVKWFREGALSYLEMSGMSDESLLEILPDITEPSQVKSIVSLFQVTLLESAKDGVSKSVYSFSAWDIEHGLAILMHKDEILHIGPDECYYEDFE